jgi:MoaA/NifB/PqqE/SkfB family radical SAM enzyme
MNKLNFPIAVQLEVTQDCNLHCNHCYNYWNYTNTIKTTEKFCDVINKIIDMDVFHVVLTGGEPLIDFKKVEYALKIFLKNNISVSLNSNLTLLNSEKAKRLKTLGLNSILTSIYSYDKSKHNQQVQRLDAFEQTIDGILFAQKEGISISVNMVVDKNNIEDVKQTGLWIKKLGVNQFCATRFCSPKKGFK